MFVGQTLLFLIPYVVYVFGGISCPIGCDCNEKMYLISCSDAGFENIPLSVPSYAKEISFSGNKLRSLGSRLFYKGLRISNLDFSLNAIDEIAHDAFLHVKHTVVELNLKGNRLARIPTPALSHLQNLRVLVLADNELEALVSRSFEKLRNLEKLDVKGNWLEQVSENAFYGLQELLHLDLSGNKLRALTPSSLRNLNSITYLDLSRNSLAKLHPNSLTHVSFIETLLLSENDLEEPFTVGTSAELGRLRVLDLSYNKLVKLSTNMFENLKRLERLNLKGNLVDEIEPDSFKTLRKLKYLDISENHLRSVSDPETWHGLENLLTLSLANNAITEISEYAFSGNTVLNSIKEIDMSYNKLAKIHSAIFSKHQTLERIDLSHNRLKVIDDNAFVNIPNLSELYLNANNLKTPNFSLFRVFFNSGNQLMEKLGSYLKENPWHCDCHLHSVITTFLREVGSNGNATSLDGAICSTPEWIKGRTFAWFASAESQNCTRKTFYPVLIVIIWTFPVIFLFCLLIMQRKTYCRNYFVLAVVIKPKRKRYDSYKRDKIL